MIKINLITEESSTRTLTNIPKVMRLVTGKDSAPKKPTNKIPNQKHHTQSKKYHTPIKIPTNQHLYFYPLHK